uniref:Uncharacterized protein n=1 Tax=Haemonchus contortus TaxID=6289 RepID=A0A7I5E6Y5_HAECO
MRTGSVLVITICVLLLISSFDCKKNKDSKNKKSKDKQYKDKNSETKVEKQKPPKEEKVKSEKAEKFEKQQKPEKAEKLGKQQKPQKAEKLEKQQETEEIVADEVIIEAPEVTGKVKTSAKNQEHAHNADSLVDTINHHQRRQIVRPKSLKVLNAYEQCKLECKKQRDSVQAQEYVEQLRAELAAAEAALAAETAAATSAPENAQSEPLFVEA